jgi:hypothetical protein
MINWFATNKLFLDLNEANIMKFVTNNSPHSALRVGYEGKCIKKMVSIRYLGVQIDNHLNWKNHIEQMFPRWSMLCSHVNGPHQ